MNSSYKDLQSYTEVILSTELRGDFPNLPDVKEQVYNLT